MFDRNGVDTIMLVETVLSAIELAKQGKITSPFDEGSEDFAAVCADIANKAIEKYGEEDENGILNGWDVVYEIADAELIKEYGTNGEKDMTKMLEQLMEEAKRINELNVQVDGIVAKRKEEKHAERVAVANHIAPFLVEMQKALRTADVKETLRIPLPFFCDNTRVLLRINQRNATDFFRSGLESLWEDGHASLYTYSNPITLIVQGAEHGGKLVWESVCDKWSQECENIVEQAVAEAVKTRLAERTAEMTERLKGV